MGVDRLSFEPMSSDAMMIDRSNGVMVIHLDDGRVNALTSAMAAGITAAVHEAESDDAIRAVVLHGRPGKFSAGFDLDVVRSGDPEAVRNLVADGADLAHTLYGAAVPVIAACTGHAIAAGAIILMACDVRIGADVEAKVGLNEVAIGMTMPAWAITIAAERLSRRHLQRSTANARLTGPRDAVDVGFLDEVVPADEVLPRAMAVATELAGSLDPTGYAQTIRLLRGAMLDRLAEQSAEFRRSGVL